MESRVNPGGLLAAVDMGSNSFRLEIGQLPNGRYRRIDYLKETVRLGAGLDANGMLTEDAAQRGLACLRHFAQRLNGFETGQVRAVATQTLREARNRNQFLLRAEVQKPIEIIRAATTVGARLLRQEGKLGCVKPGALADLIVVAGNPVKDLRLFQDQGRHIPLIMKGGKLHKNALG